MIKIISYINYPCNSIQLFTFEIKQNIKKQNVNICVNQIKYKLIKMENRRWINFKVDEQAKIFVMLLL